MSNPFQPPAGGSAPQSGFQPPAPDPQPAQPARSVQPEPFGQSAPTYTPDQDYTVEPMRSATGPWPYVIAATVASIVGVILAVVNWMSNTSTQPAWLGLAATGWVLCGIITFILLGVHTSVDTRRQTTTLYLSNTTQTLLFRLSLGAGIVGVILTAIQIALWFGKAFGA
ncbi:Uncharacterised protein [Corynebacterium renale]|uniref:hypothetical protein n=1 Tax=Corynebacterium renale TaxID=1724 RepID=UPI000DA316A9|nr:hypothetical protein [Corynebacterium renale]SQG63574.1 Uncharacterised protein [Corynebacterium renale]STD00996.1 Uncharacterised protein [Corynebacterium renale]